MQIKLEHERHDAEMKVCRAFLLSDGLERLMGCFLHELSHGFRSVLPLLVLSCCAR
jgi:hypothetical protein